MKIVIGLLIGIPWGTLRLLVSEIRGTVATLVVGWAVSLIALIFVDCVWPRAVGGTVVSLAQSGGVRMDTAADISRSLNARPHAPERSDGSVQADVGPCPICGDPGCLGNECEPEPEEDDRCDQCGQTSGCLLNGLCPMCYETGGGVLHRRSNAPADLPAVAGKVRRDVGGSE